jgi:hypothetical protein
LSCLRSNPEVSAKRLATSPRYCYSLFLGFPFGSLRAVRMQSEDLPTIGLSSSGPPCIRFPRRRCFSLATDWLATVPQSSQIVRQKLRSAIWEFGCLVQEPQDSEVSSGERSGARDFFHSPFKLHAYCRNWPPVCRPGDQGFPEKSGMDSRFGLYEYRRRGTQDPPTQIVRVQPSTLPGRIGEAPTANSRLFFEVLARPTAASGGSLYLNGARRWHAPRK